MRHCWVRIKPCHVLGIEIDIKEVVNKAIKINAYQHPASVGQSWERNRIERYIFTDLYLGPCCAPAPIWGPHPDG